MPDGEKPLLLRIAEGEVTNDGAEPVQLWLVPVLLRSRKQYYDDMVAGVRRRIESIWETNGFMYQTRQEFDDSPTVVDAWRIASPLWWGLNDIIGFIDVRLHSNEIAASLFVTTKRPSRVLTVKDYVCRRTESAQLRAGATNAELRRDVIEVVERLATDDRLKRRFVDVERWRPLVESTDLVALLESERRRGRVS